MLGPLLAAGVPEMTHILLVLTGISADKTALPSLSRCRQRVRQ